MKILVTGGAGFIGTNLLLELKKQNHKLVSVDNYSIGTKENHIEGVKYISLDVNQIKEIKNDFDLIYHLAGLSRIQPSFREPTSTFISNTKGVESVIEWARLNHTKIVYSGSSSFHHDPYQSPYAFYKYLGEEICRMYRRVYDMNIEIVRFYNVYGPKEIVHGEWAAVIGIWRSQIKNNLSLTIVGDGEQKRDFTHVHDIVDALLKIGINKTKFNNEWELGTGINYSLNEVYQMFKEKFGVDKIHINDQLGNYRETLRIDNKALKLLNWKPKDRLKKYIMNL
tara:strand:+ start:5317 stop:6162 length:846 start_codon:yes stop_codon:yes gene_type:complete